MYLYIDFGFAPISRFVALACVLEACEVEDNTMTSSHFFLDSSASLFDPSVVFYIVYTINAVLNTSRELRCRALGSGPSNI
jgi:hypothetical protein